MKHTIVEMRTIAVEDEWSFADIRDRDKTKIFTPGQVHDDLGVSYWPTLCYSPGLLAGSQVTDDTGSALERKWLQLSKANLAKAALVKILVGQMTMLEYFAYFSDVVSIPDLGQNIVHVLCGILVLVLRCLCR